MTGPRVVRVGAPSAIRVVRIGDPPTPTAVIVGGGASATTLDGLTDVDGATAAVTGQILAKAGDGQWRPTTISAAGPQSYTHTQVSPATVWLITHGLGFDPAGVEVFDHLAARHYPLVSYLAGQVRLDFNTPVRGTARLS